MKITEHFSLSEFNCRDGTPVPQEYIPHVEELCRNLEILRAELDCPIHVNSGYRTNHYNTQIGGAIASQHLLAKAADITCRDYSPREVADKIEVLVEEGKMKDGGLGRYRGFTHYDVRDHHSRWGTNG